MTDEQQAEQAEDLTPETGVDSVDPMVDLATKGTRRRKPTPARIVFEVDSGVYLYEFKRATLEQVFRAKAIFEFVGERIANPPRTWREFEVGKGEDYIARAIGGMLLKKEGPDKYAPVDPEEGRKVILSLTGEDFPKVDLCRTDFFFWGNVQDVGSMLRITRAAQVLSLVSGSNPPKSDNKNESGNLRETPDGTPDDTTTTKSTEG